MDILLRWRSVKPTLGNVDNKRLKSATVKPIHVFVSRLNTDTRRSIIEYVVDATNASAAGTVVSANDISCEKLDTKSNTYSSFRLYCHVKANIFKDVADVLLSGDAWPEGVLIRRYFTKRKSISI